MSVQRLNYIGSKYQLLDWIQGVIREKTGWSSFAGKRFADLFAGTGIVSHSFRLAGSSVISNDAELYSSIIAHAFTRSVYSDTCKMILTTLEQELETKAWESTIGRITKEYSPYNGCARMFFTVDNAKRIDYIRGRIESFYSTIPSDDSMFLLATLLIAADAVSNVPAVYGCYLKSFKAKALKPLHLTPIHTCTDVAGAGCKTFCSDVLSPALLTSISADFAYLDPPYNERHYSKNYFPLNRIAISPSLVASQIHGKTGIPDDCFMSPFCKKSTVAAAFDTLISGLSVPWIFLSYNSESLVSKDDMLVLLGKYGTVSVVEREYKRFKSFEYNDDKAIREYLFCLNRAV